VGGLREIVPDRICGYVVKPEPKEIADSIVDFMDNSRNDFFTKNVAQEKKKFLWNRMISSILGVYNNIAENDNKK
jgi:glycosyltransferase involved in cell wall biosynthesis